MRERGREGTSLCPFSRLNIPLTSQKKGKKKNEQYSEFNKCWRPPRIVVAKQRTSRQHLSKLLQPGQFMSILRPKKMHFRRFMVITKSVLNAASIFTLFGESRSRLSLPPLSLLCQSLFRSLYNTSFGLILIVLTLRSLTLVVILFIKQEAVFTHLTNQVRLGTSSSISYPPMFPNLKVKARRVKWFQVGQDRQQSGAHKACHNHSAS